MKERKCFREEVMNNVRTREKGLKSILLALAVRLLMTLAREVSVVNRSKLDGYELRNEWEMRK